MTSCLSVSFTGSHVVHNAALVKCRPYVSLGNIFSCCSARLAPLGFVFTKRFSCDPFLKEELFSCGPRLLARPRTHLSLGQNTSLCFVHHLYEPGWLCLAISPSPAQPGGASRGTHRLSPVPAARQRARGCLLSAPGPDPAAIPGAARREHAEPDPGSAGPRISLMFHPLERAEGLHDFSSPAFVCLHFQPKNLQS